MELDTKVSSLKISSKSKKISEYIVDETLLKVGSEYVWLWVAIEPENRNILTLYIYQRKETYSLQRDLFQI